MTMHPIPLNFLIYEENFILFFISAVMHKNLTAGEKASLSNFKLYEGK